MGSRSDAMQYFANIGYPVPNLYNPADYYIQTLAIDLNDRENSLLKVKVNIYFKNFLETKNN